MRAVCCLPVPVRYVRRYVRRFPPRSGSVTGEFFPPETPFTTSAAAEKHRRAPTACSGPHQWGHCRIWHNALRSSREAHPQWISREGGPADRGMTVSREARATGRKGRGVRSERNGSLGQRLVPPFCPLARFDGTAKKKKFMPSQPVWLSRLFSILSELRALDGDYLDRRTLERIFWIRDVERGRLWLDFRT
jgi:hypothetical protein